ncbi:MAG: hypothetical protein HPY80_09230 [Bacteroidales bacterium]|jgi:hypothetical protein|nr:hypothetical protein [Bacteroidales bacterium]
MAGAIITKLPNNYNREVGYISHYHELDIRQLALYDGLILDYTDQQGCVNLLRQCRSSFIGTLYLLPIFIYSIDKNIDPIAESLSDGVVSSLQVEGVIGKIDKIRNKQVNLAAIDSVSPDIRIMTKVLRFLYTRETRLTPVVNPNSNIGYFYPILSEHYKNGDLSELFKILDDGIQKEYLRPRFVDRLHLCSNCYSGFINFRETCPKCNSADLVTENLIHHFVCAYVGPEHDFHSGDYLVCPKCNRMLRHIGVDYDKPSIIYNCRNCSHIFQEPVMEAFCFNCQKKNPVEALIDKQIYSYELTPIGEETAINGFGREIREEFELPGFITFTTFNIFLKYEVERAKNSGRISSAGSLILSMSDEDRNRMGPGYRKLAGEIADFIKNATFSTDILSFVNNNTYLIISPDSEPTRLQNLLENIRQSVHKLLLSNLVGYSFNLVPKVVTISSDKNHSDLINQLITP